MADDGDPRGVRSVASIDSDGFTQQLLIMWFPLFEVSKVEWKLLQQKVIMRHCLLKQDVPGTDL